jgi:hypothetical protein
LRGEDGRAFDKQQIFSGDETDYAPVFRALTVQRYHRFVYDGEFFQLLKAHVDWGVALTKNDTIDFKSEDNYVDYLVGLTRKVIEQRME